MEIIRAFTTIEQSRKLAEILPLESADMYYFLDPTPAGNIYIPSLIIKEKHLKSRMPEYDKGDIPCWSLTSLLDVLSKWAERANESGIAELSYEKASKWCVSMLNCGKIKDCYADNPVDACVAMVEKLNELNLL